MTEDKSISEITEDILSKLPLDLRCEIDENNQRKSYSTLEIADIQEKISRELKKMFPSGRKSENSKLVGSLKDLGHERTDDVVGSMTGESGEQVRRRREIKKAIEKNPEKYKHTLKKVDAGKTTFTTLYHQVNKRENIKTPELPNGIFNTFYVDPPWLFDFGLSGAASNHYNTMPLEEICDLGKKIPAANDAYLFLWTTLSKINEGCMVMEAWNFKFKSSMCWVKEKEGKVQNGMGTYVMGAHELLLIGEKGNMPAPLPENRPSSVIKAPRGKHSAKPEILYDIIEKMVPQGKYLELFARPQKKRPNWKYWGHEAK